MEKVTIGNAELWHGDCLELMAGMADAAVDHVLTDVPYHAKTHKNAELANKTEGTAEKKIDFMHITDDKFRAMFMEFNRVCKRWVVSTCDLLHAPLVYGWPEFIRQGVWVKDNPMPQLTGDRPGQGYEVVLIMHKAGKKKWNGGGKPGVWNFPLCSAGEYPTQKPQPLLDRLVADFTDYGETVLDPCMGSGTTGVAAVQQDRKFIGCEARREAFEIACTRIEAAQAQQRLAL